MPFSIGAVVSVQGETEFSQKMKALKTEMGYTKSASEALTSQYSKNDKSVEALSARSDGLKKSMKLQEEAVEAAKSALERMKANGLDEADEGFRRMQQNVDRATTELNKTKVQLEELEEQLGKTEEGEEGVNNGFEQMGTYASSALAKIIDAGGKASADFKSGNWAGFIANAANCVEGIAGIGKAAIDAVEKSDS